jgi:hypothetical protein
VRFGGQAERSNRRRRATYCGERVRLGLVSTDGATKVFAKVVPVALGGEDHGCSVDAILLTPGAELVLIVSSGFPPNSDVTMDSRSQDERQGGKGKLMRIAAM